jgi:thiol-disulfide isomerase/thioredoxin
MLTADLLRATFDAALPYDAYVRTGTPDQQAHWARFHERVRLTDAQRKLLTSFTRRLHILVSSGVWCGDCVQQCPMLDHIARATDRIHLRFVDRDQHADLAERVRICSGLRVPVVILANEDFDFVALAGDRTLARYRALAARQLGPACPLPGAPVPDDEIAATLADWVNEVERAHLLCRLSTKLRHRHND